MTGSRGLAAAAATIVAVAAAGCGFGPGEASEGEATLSVTRDYGSELLFEATVEDPAGSETVMRLLDREAEITTRYGGGFVQSIDGIAGAIEGGRRLDWFFYVNGVESAIGAAEAEVRAGDRVWWDYRDWTAAMRVPAVVGSFPQPFLGGGARPASVGCLTERAICGEVRESLGDAGVETSLADRIRPPSENAVRVLVGPWEQLRGDRTVGAIEDGPATSGVFADFERAGDSYELVALDETASEASTLERGSGLVAAVREGDNPPIWLVTGTDRAGVRRAAELLDEASLRDLYALAVQPSGEPLALPVVE